MALELGGVDTLICNEVLFDFTSLLLLSTTCFCSRAETECHFSVCFGLVLFSRQSDSKLVVGFSVATESLFTGLQNYLIRYLLGFSALSLSFCARSTACFSGLRDDSPGGGSSCGASFCQITGAHLGRCAFQLSIETESASCLR